MLGGTGLSVPLMIRERSLLTLTFCLHAYHGMWHENAQTKCICAILERPNQVHMRHPHTMGDDDCAWFGCNHATARALPRIW